MAISNMSIPPTTLHAMVERQAALTPHAVAVIGDCERVSYRELERRAAWIAQHITAASHETGRPVGVLLRRTPALIATILGILKTGRAFLPLDASLPQERQVLMLRDSGSQLVVTQASLSGHLPAGPFARLLVEECVPGEGAIPYVVPSCEETAPAYILYTSGSTGQPKGVVLTHRNAVALIQWAHQAFSRDELAVVLASTTVTFDLSIFEIFAPLTMGGSLALALNILRLPTLAAREEVTLIQAVPSVMVELLRMHGPSAPIPTSVRTVLLAGEALPRPLVTSLYRLPHIERVWNLYGPSETTTYASAGIVPRGASGNPGIGRALPGNRVYLLDEDLQPVTGQDPGELYIGGAGVALGYLGQPEFTAERFVLDPFGCNGERMYRTGDLARRRADGELEYIGRVDHQVKIHGVRIEPGEIEAWLEQLPMIGQAVVIPVRSRDKDLYLVAFLTVCEGVMLSQAQAELGQPAILSHLQRFLPAQVVIREVVWVEQFPCTANGKLDRAALALQYQNQRPALE